MSRPDDVSLPLASSLQQVVGALVFGADHPLTVDEIRKCLQDVAKADPATVLFATVAPRDVRDALEGIGHELERLGLGIELSEVSGAFRFQTQAACGRWIRQMLGQERPNRLSRPALETLAIVAYRQPIAKSEIEGIRGVAVDHILKALMELHLVRIVGRSELPGRPFLYGTTASFLDHFGLKNLNELNEMDPTLQRSKTSERKAIHKKEKRKEEQAADAGPLFEEKRPDAAPVSSEAVNEILGEGVSAENAEPLYEERTEESE